MNVAQSLPNSLELNSQRISGVRDHIEKANQSQAVWLDGNWWGCFRSTSGNDNWRIYNLTLDSLNNGNWSSVTSLGVDSEDQVDMHVNPSDSSLFVLFSTHELVYRLSYTGHGWSIDSGFPKSVSINAISNDPASITQANDGDLFIFVSASGKLLAKYSSDRGESWSSFTVGNASSALTDAIPFFDGVGWNIGVFAGEGSGSLDYSFYRIADTLAVDSSHHWIEENLPFGGYPELDADDHVNIIRDENHNLYAICKLGDGGPSFFLLKRDNFANWQVFEIETNGGTRPALSFDSSNKRVFAFATNENQIHYIAQHRDSLENVAASDWRPVLANGSNAFNNVSAPYQVLDENSDLLVLGENESRGELWYNVIDIRPANIPKFTLLTNTIGLGSISLNPPPISGPSTAGVYDSATVVAVTAIPNSGYTFAGWSGDLNGTTNPATILMDTTKSITASFALIPPADIAVAPNNHDFGLALPGSGVLKTFEIRNTGSQDLLINDATILNDTFGSFAIESGGLPVTIAPGQTHQLVVRFTPVILGDASATLQIISNDPDENPLDIPLSGTGVETLPEISLKEIQSGNVSDANQISTSFPLEAVDGNLYLASIASRSFKEVAAVSGLGLSWQKVRSQCAGRNQTGVEVWMAQGTVITSEVVTATFSSSIGNAVITVARYAGSDPESPIGNIISGNTNGESGNCSGGSDNDAYVFNVAASTQGAIIFGAAAMRNRSHEPENGFQERSEMTQGSGGGAASLTVVDYTAEAAENITLAGGFSNDVDWAAIGLEIKPGNVTEPEFFPLATSITGNGIIQMNPPGGEYEALTEVTLTAIPDQGHQFNGWSGDLSGAENPATIVMDTAKSVTANFTESVQTYTVATNILGSGSILLAPEMPTGGYPENTAVTVTAIPGAGFQFSGWGVDLSGFENPATLIMDSDKTIYAVFNALSSDHFTLSITLAGAGSVMLDPLPDTPVGNGGEYQAGTVVTITVTPDPDNTFSGWSGDLSGTNNSATITMDTDKNVTATFDPDTPGGGGGPVVFEEIQTGSAIESEIVSLDAPISAVSGDLYLAAITSKNRRDVVSVTGLGLSWNRVKAQCSGRDQTGVEVWMAIGNADGDGIVSAAFTHATTNSVIAVSRYSGVDPSTPLGMTVAGNTNGLDGGCSDGVDGNAYQFDITTETESAIVYGAVAMRNRRHTAGDGYSEHIELAGGSGGSAATLAVMDRSVASPATISLEGSFNKTVDWAVIGLEIRSGGSGGGGSTQRTLSFGTVGSGTINIDPPGGTYEDGTTVSITATPSAGFEFSGWSGDAGGTENPLSLVMDDDKSITATFTEQNVTTYTLTTTIIGEGEVVLSPPGGVYNEGTAVALTAIPHSGFEFANWSDGLSGAENPQTLIINSDKSVTANFVELPPDHFTLSITLAGAGSVTLDPLPDTPVGNGGEYQAGTVVTITVTPDPDNTFSGWSGDLSGTNNSATITMDTDKNVTATFDPDTPGGGGGPVVFEEIQTGSAIESEIVSLDAPISAVSGDLYLAAITSKNRRDVVSVTGLGLSWNRVKAQCSGRDQTGVEVWMAIGNADGDGIVSAAFTHATTNSVIAVSRYSGVDPSTPLGMTVAGNTNGLDGGCSDGVDGNAYQFDITTETESAIVYGAVAMRNRRHTAGDGYSEHIELAGGSGGSAATLAVMDRSVASPATISLEGSFNKTVDWAVIGLEIRSGGSGGGGSTQRTLSFGTVGSGTINIDPPGGTYEDGTTVSITATPSAGFEFSGWSGDAGGTENPLSLVMDDDKSITATFTEQNVTTYTLTTTIIGEGEVVLSPPGGVYNEGTVVTITAVPGVGKSFAGWAGDLFGADNPTSITMDADKNIIAGFIELPPSQNVLNVNINGEGSVSLDPPPISVVGDGGEYLVGTVVTVTAIPDSGYEFSGWSGDLNGADNPQTLVINTDKSVTTNFSEQTGPQYTLTLHVFGGGEVVLDPPQESSNGSSYPAGTVVNVTAIPDAGFQFSGWSGALSGFANPGTITMDSDKTLITAFTELPQLFFDVDISLNGAGTVTLDPPPQEETSTGGSYLVGTVVTLTAIPDTGQQFDEWSGDLNGSDNPQSFTMFSDKTITANFSPQTGGGNSGPVVYEETVTGGATEMDVVSTADPVIAVSGDFYLATIVTKNFTDVLSVSGLGLPWVRVKTQCSGRSMTGVEIWMTMGTPGLTGDDVVSATLASSPSNSIIAVSRYSGVDSSTPLGMIVSGNTNGLNGDCSGGTDSDAYNFDFATTTEGGYIFNTIALRNRRHTPGDNFTELLEVVQDGALGGDKATLAIQEQIVETPATVAMDGTFNRTVDWAAVGIEIRPAGTAKMAFTPSNSGKVRSSRNKAVENKSPKSDGLRAANLTSAENRYYWKFNLNSIGNHSIISAMLKIFVEEASQEELSLYPVSNNFKNARTTWTTTDLNDITAPEVKGDKISAVNQIKPGSWVEFDVTKIIIGSGSYSFAMSASDDVRISSQESAGEYRPQLIVQLGESKTPVPQPEIHPDIPGDVAILNIPSGSFMANQTTAIPEEIVLGANYPDPFNAETTIEYALPQDADVLLEVYNILGQRVRVLVNEVQSTGFKSIIWNSTDDAGNGVASGVYFIQLTIGERRLAKKMTLMR